MAPPYLFSSGSELLARFDNYHLPRKNATFDLHIWHWHLWGGRLQMAVIGGTPGYRREWQGAFRPRRLDILMALSVFIQSSAKPPPWPGDSPAAP